MKSAIYDFCNFFSFFVLVLLSSVCIGTEKVIYFSVFSPEHVNCLSNSSAYSFMIEIIYKYSKFSHFYMISVVAFLVILWGFFYKNNSLFFKDSQNVCIESLLLYTLCLFPMLLIDVIVDIERSDRICLPTYVLPTFKIWLSIV